MNKATEFFLPLVSKIHFSLQPSEKKANGSIDMKHPLNRKKKSFELYIIFLTLFSLPHYQ